MRKPSWLERADRAFGFHEDERVLQVHGSAVRAAYIVMAVATVPFGAFQEYVLQQRGALWVTLAILASSLAMLAVRRVQLNGFGAADERMIRAWQSVFFWPALMLPFGMFVYATYLLLAGGDGRSIMVLALYNMLTPLVIMITRVLNGTAQGNALYWLLCGVFTLGLFTWNIRTVGPAMLAAEQAGTSGPEALTMIVVLALSCTCVFGVICLIAAWRRWQEQRNNRHGY